MEFFKLVMKLYGQGGLIIILKVASRIRNAIFENILIPPSQEVL